MFFNEGYTVIGWHIWWWIQIPIVSNTGVWKIYKVLQIMYILHCISSAAVTSQVKI